MLISRLSFLATNLMSSRWVYHHRGEPASYWSGILGTAGPRLRLPKHNTTHHYILPRSLCITILPFLVGTAALCLEIPISVVIRVGAGNDAIPTFDFSVGFGCTITPFTLAIVQSKFSFLRFSTEGWTWCVQDFPLALMILDERNKKNRESAGRILESFSFWQIFSSLLYVFSEWDSRISSKTNTKSYLAAKLAFRLLNPVVTFFASTTYPYSNPITFVTSNPHHTPAHHNTSSRPPNITT